MKWNASDKFRWWSCSWHDHSFLFLCHCAPALPFNPRTSSTSWSRRFHQEPSPCDHLNEPPWAAHCFQLINTMNDHRLMCCIWVMADNRPCLGSLCTCLVKFTRGWIWLIRNSWPKNENSLKPVWLSFYHGTKKEIFRRKLLTVWHPCTSIVWTRNQRKWMGPR